MSSVVSIEPVVSSNETTGISPVFIASLKVLFTSKPPRTGSACTSAIGSGATVVTTFGGNPSVNVLVSNWKAFEKLRIFAAYCPGGYFSDVRLTYPLRFADYESARSTDEPMTVHMYRIPLPGELSAVEQLREGRYDLEDTSFEKFERKIREQLGAMLGEGGFDPARDIKAITVNRWPHGYASSYDTEDDESKLNSNRGPYEERIWQKGRKQFGRISIANSDATPSAMTESAIEQGFRATKEILDGLE